ncbi:hypothetical protein HZS_7597, partial [Henneguya salminicola]
MFNYYTDQWGYSYAYPYYSFYNDQWLENSEYNYSESHYYNSKNLKVSNETSINKSNPKILNQKNKGEKQPIKQKNGGKKIEIPSENITQNKHLPKPNLNPPTKKKATKKAAYVHLFSVGNILSLNSLEREKKLREYVKTPQSAKTIIP